MKRDLYAIIAAKTDEQLQTYIDNPSRYTKEAVEAAIAELRKRGNIIPEEKEVKLLEEVEKQKHLEEHRSALPDLNVNITSDPTAPQLYSRGAIGGFTVFFAPIFGAVLLTMNLNRIGKRNIAALVLIFSIIYMAVEVYLLNTVPQLRRTNFLFSGFAALILDQIFWKKYFEAIQYRKRPIWVPLIVSIIICIPFLLATYLA